MKARQVTSKDLVHLLATNGGQIVNTKQCTPEEVVKAKEERRLWCDEYESFIWRPPETWKRHED